VALGIDDGTVHDLRRTGSTLLTSERIGVSPFIRSKVLAHYDAGGGAQVSATRYDANSYVREKRAALEKWQRLLSDVVGREGSPCAPAQRFDSGHLLSAGFNLQGVLPSRAFTRNPAILFQG
jgi:hypothetical protein